MEKIESVEDLEASFLEMKSVELADVVVSPSEYLLDWMSTVAKWKIPENEEGVFVQPYVLPVEAKKAMIEALDVENYIKTKIGGEEKGDDDHRTIDRIGGASSSSSSSSSSRSPSASSWVRPLEFPGRGRTCLRPRGLFPRGVAQSPGACVRAPVPCRGAMLGCRVLSDNSQPCGSLLAFS